MDKTTRIRSLLRSIAGTDKAVFDFRLLEVTAVDGDLCRAKLGDLEIPDIRLSSVAGGSENGVLAVPAVGSVILAADLSCGNLREMNVVACSEVESIRYHQGKTTLTADAEGVTVEVGDSKLRIEDGKITFNDGDNHGLVKVEELTKKLNTLEQEINDLKLVLLTWQPSQTPDSGAALKTATAKWAGKQLNTTRRQDLENDKITH